jgi:GNAT superfamily N-acetyltransferase
MTARRQPAADGTDTAVLRAGQPDVDALSQVIADAFFPLAPCRWLIADRAARREIMPGYFRILAEHAMARGVVYTTAGRTAAALWIPTGPEGPDQPDRYDDRLAEITGPWAAGFAVFDQELDAHHLTGLAHHHLAILAVRPDRQGQGIGTALLDAHHAVLDQEGTAAYLEAADERTRGLYLRHGYADHGSPIELPDGPRMYPMVRHPRTTGNHQGPGTHRDQGLTPTAASTHTGSDRSMMLVHVPGVRLLT